MADSIRLDVSIDVFVYACLLAAASLLPHFIRLAELGCRLCSPLPAALRYNALGPHRLLAFLRAMHGEQPGF